MAKKKKQIKPVVGNKVEFIAVRITRGNPVQGKVISTDDEGFTLVLSKEIEGINTVWLKGEQRSFDYDLIHSLKVL